MGEVNVSSLKINFSLNWWFKIMSSWKDYHPVWTLMNSLTPKAWCGKRWRQKSPKMLSWHPRMRWGWCFSGWSLARCTDTCASYTSIRHDTLRILYLCMAMLDLCRVFCSFPSIGLVSQMADLVILDLNWVRSISYCRGYHSVLYCVF